MKLYSYILMLHVVIKFQGGGGNMSGGYPEVPLCIKPWGIYMFCTCHVCCALLGVCTCMYVCACMVDEMYGWVSGCMYVHVW